MCSQRRSAVGLRGERRLELALQLGETLHQGLDLRLLSLVLAVLPLHLVQQHGVHLVILHRLDLPVRVMDHQVGSYLSDSFRNETILQRPAGRMRGVLEGDGT